MLARDGGHACGFVLNGGRVPIGLHQQDRRAVGGQADLGVVLHAAGGHAIEELERAGDDARGDDGRHGLGRVLDAVVERQHRPACLRLRDELEQHLRDDAERAFGADEEILHRISRDVLHARAAEARDGAVGEHHLEGHHVVARDPVLQSAQAARVLGDVAADGADPHRARVGRVEQSMATGGFVDLHRDGASLRTKRQVLGVHLEDRVHLCQADDKCVGTRHAAAAQPGAGPSRHHGNPCRMREAHHAGHLLRGGRQDHGTRPRCESPQCRRTRTG